ncbi:MAG: hypothetical protein JWM12_4371 [Ilumatobacteraceae bacterium]|nr:hypothetical protein [Ilumatobacteraceae bacterium]
MRINARTWPAWAAAAVTVWFVAITVFWATRPLVDHVPTTVTAVQVAGQPPIKAGARAPGPTIEVTCGAPAESKVTDATVNAAELAALRDKAGAPLLDPQFAREPCTSSHQQSRILWFLDTGLYIVALAALGAVLVRRRRHSQPPTPAFASTV